MAKIPLCQSSWMNYYSTVKLPTAGFFLVHFGYRPIMILLLDVTLKEWHWKYFIIMCLPQDIIMIQKHQGQSGGYKFVHHLQLDGTQCMHLLVLTMMMQIMMIMIWPKVEYPFTG